MSTLDVASDVEYSVKETDSRETYICKSVSRLTLLCVSARLTRGRLRVMLLKVDEERGFLGLPRLSGST
jgi:hypothetical protein